MEESVIQPESDYETWCFVFEEALGSTGNNYTVLIPSYCRLVDSIITTNLLPDPISENTTSFIYNFMPNIVNKLIQIGFIYQKDASKVNQFFISTTTLIPWLTERKEFDTVKSILSILSAESNFYQHNGYSVYNRFEPSKYWKDVFKHFIDHCIPQLIMQCLDESASLIQFSLVFMVAPQLLNFEFDIQKFSPAVDAFIKFLENLNIRNISDISELQKCVLNYSDLVLLYYQLSVPKLIELSEKFIRSKILDEQFLGISIIQAISDSQNPTVKSYFSEWISHTDLAKYILNQDFNPSFYERIKPILVKLMNQELLHKLWNNVLISHSSQRKPMLDILSRAIASLEDESTKEFIDLIVNESAKDNQPISPDIFRFLTNVAISFAAINISMGEYIAGIIFQQGLNPINQQNSIDSLLQIAINPHFQRFLFKKCCIQLSNATCIDFVIRILETIIEKSPNLSFKQLKATLISIISQQNDVYQNYKRKLCDLFVRILGKTKQPITEKIVNSFNTNGIDNSLFIILLHQLQTKGIAAFDQAVNMLLLDQIIPNYDFTTATEEFAQFLFFFLVKLNIECHKIELQNVALNDIKIKEIPLIHMELIIRLYCQTNNGRILSFLTNSIIRLMLGSLISFTDVHLYLIDLIKDYLINVDSLSTFRVLTLIQHFIKQIECSYYIEDLKYQRHRPTNFAGFFDITVTIPLNQRLQYITMKVNPNEPIQLLTNRVSAIIGYPSSSLFPYFNYSYLTQEYSLYESGIQNNSTIRMELFDINGTSHTYFPSIVLTELNFQSYLLRIIDENKDSNVTKLASSILDLLPNAPEYSQSITIEQIKDSQSKNAFLYKLQIFAQLYRNLNSENYSFFLDLLSVKDEVIDKEIACESLSFINKTFDAELLQNDFEQLIRCSIAILNDYQNQEYFNSALELLNKIVLENPKMVTDICFENLHVIERIIEKDYYDQKTFHSLISLFDNLENVKPIFEICLSHLNETSHNDNYITVFSHVIYNVIDCVDLDQVFVQCMKSLDVSLNRFTELCKVINSLYKVNPCFSEKYGVEIIDKMLTSTFRADDSNLRTAAFSICEVTVKNSTESASKAVSFLTPYIEKTYDFFGYSPSNNIKSQLNYAGLRNLGSTCYMNSIFQQLFFVPPFCTKIISEDFSKYTKKEDNPDNFIDENIESHNHFQYLFSEMLLTNQKLCDTQKFCSCWKGWGKAIINTHEQQDAFEFLQLFLDQFPPSINHLFKGKIKNTMKGDNFESANFEPFYTFSLSIQNCSNILDSFHNFLQSETFQQYKLDDGRCIETSKYSRICEAPTILVLQLKRFEYNLQTWEKIKINKRVEFGYLLNIKDYMEDQSEDVNYKLTGVVLHSGNAIGGHYTSVINLNNKWVLFNDQEVKEISESEFQQNAFGGQATENEYNAPCAFLLFYSKIHSEIDGISCFYDKVDQNVLKNRIKPEIRDEIIKANSTFFSVQNVFSQPMFNFVMALNDTEFILKYFVNVFCHSGINSGAKCYEILFSQIKRMNTNRDTLYNFLIKSSDEIDHILINSSNFETCKLLVKIIISCLEYVESNRSVEYVEHFFNVLNSVVKNWRQIPSISAIIEVYLTVYKNFIPIAIERGWVSRLLDFIKLVYEGQKSTVLVKNVDLSYVFASLSLLVQIIKDESMLNEVTSVFSAYLNLILSSQVQLPWFVQLIMIMPECSSLNIGQIISILTTKDCEPDQFNTLVVYAVSITKTQAQAQLIIKSLLLYSKSRSAFFALGKRLKSGDDKIRNFFLQFPEDTLLVILTNSDSGKWHSGESLFNNLFYKTISANKFNNLAYNDEDKIYTQEELQQEITEMRCMLDHFHSFAINELIPNMENYYANFGKTPQHYSSEGSFQLSHYAKVLRSLVMYSKILDMKTFEICKQLIDRCIEMKVKQIDYNVLRLCEVLALYDPSLTKPFIIDIFNTIMDNANAVDQSYDLTQEVAILFNLIIRSFDSLLIDLLPNANFFKALEVLKDCRIPDGQKILSMISSYLICFSMQLKNKKEEIEIKIKSLTEIPQYDLNAIDLENSSPDQEIAEKPDVQSNEATPLQSTENQKNIDHTSAESNDESIDQFCPNSSNSVESDENESTKRSYEEDSIQTMKILLEIENSPINQSISIDKDNQYSVELHNLDTLQLFKKLFDFTILSLFDPDTLGDLSEETIHSLFPLFTHVINELTPKTIITMFLTIVSKIIRYSYSIQFDQTLQTISQFFDYIYFFINYLKSHPNFSFSNREIQSVQIKYIDIVRFITFACSKIKFKGETIENIHMQGEIREKYTTMNESYTISSTTLINRIQNAIKTKKSFLNYKINQSFNLQELITTFIYFIYFISQIYQPFFNSVIKGFSSHFKGHLNKKQKMIDYRSMAIFCVYYAMYQLEDSPNKDEVLSNLELLLNQVVSSVREMQKVTSIHIVFDFLNSQINLLKDANEPNKLLLRDFFLNYAKVLTMNDFIIDNIISGPSLTFYKIGFDQMNEEEVSNLFEFIVTSVSDISPNEAIDDVNLLMLRKLWFLLRKAKNNMQSTLRNQFHELITPEDDCITKEYLESLNMNGLATVLFSEPYFEVIVKDDDDDIFDYWKCVEKELTRKSIYQNVSFSEVEDEEDQILPQYGSL